MSVSKGSFGWYELMTTDPAAAGEFYSNVVGWTTQAVGSPQMPYSVFNVNGFGVAGLMTLPEAAGTMPAWIGYIHVDDVDAFAQRVTEAGGAIHRPPTDVPDMLRFCVVTDAEGAPFVLFTPNPAMPTPPGRPVPGSVGTIGWHELMANDGEAAFKFYSGLFGWSKGEAHDMGPMGVYQTIEDAGVQVGGMMNKPPQVPVPFWSYYFHVDAIEAAIDRIKSSGGTIVTGPHQVPGGSWIVQGSDPQGAMFCLMSMAR